MSPEEQASAVSTLPRAPMPVTHRILMAGLWGLFVMLVCYNLMSRIAPLIWHHRPGPDFPDLGILFIISGSAVLAGFVGLVGGAIFGAWRCYAPRISGRMLFVLGCLPVPLFSLAIACEVWGWKQSFNLVWPRILPDGHWIRGSRHH